MMVAPGATGGSRFIGRGSRAIALRNCVATVRPYVEEPSMDRNQQSPAEFVDAIARTLYTAVLSDVLDELGYRRQAFPPSIRPLDDELVLVGFARTGIYREVCQALPGDNPYELEIKLIDSLGPCDVVVLGCGGSQRIAPWGELLTTASRVRGATGCVTDGFVRDIKAIRKARFPVYHGGIAPLDSKGRGKVAEIDAPIMCAGVEVAPGDLVVGDADGVIVVPRTIESVALERALKKVDGEDRTREALLRGVALRDVFAEYNVL